VREPLDPQSNPPSLLTTSRPKTRHQPNILNIRIFTRVLGFSFPEIARKSRARLPPGLITRWIAAQFFCRGVRPDLHGLIASALSKVSSAKRQRSCDRARRSTRPSLHCDRIFPRGFLDHLRLDRFPLHGPADASLDRHWILNAVKPYFQDGIGGRYLEKAVDPNPQSRVYAR